jgi:hypothetical protein
MKKSVLTTVFVVLAGFACFAHPGHHHEGNVWQVVWHFITTYYIYLFLGGLAIFGLAKYLVNTKRKQEKA